MRLKLVYSHISLQVNKSLTMFVAVFFSISTLGSAQYMLDSTAFRTIKIINEEKINSKHLEFSPSFYRDDILFVFTNDNARKDENIDDYFMDIGYAVLDSEGHLGKRASIEGKINGDMHEGPATFDPTNGTLYFSRAYYNESKYTKRDSIFNKIYEANERNNFRVVKEINISSEDYDIMHPTLSSDGHTMIFASNKVKSNGKDLYVSHLENGKWSDPISLADSLTHINTRSNEAFPFLWQDSVLFFASDRPHGAGGLDIYVSFFENGQWTKPIGLPYPINSSFDDFGLILDRSKTYGYFSSNRPNGKGKDDIYYFDAKTPIIHIDNSEKWVDVSISILDKLTLSPIENAKLVVTPLEFAGNFNLTKYDIDMIAGENEGEVILKLSPKKGLPGQPIMSNEEGQIQQVFGDKKKYLLAIEKEGYEPEVLLFDPINDDKEIGIVLDPIAKAVVETPTAPPPTKSATPTGVLIPVTKNSVVVFNNIYYDYNSDKIITSSTHELEALYEAMVANPSMKVELIAHTDSRGKNEYNLDLSLRRAKAAKGYLVQKGIDFSRIVTIGKGETMIRNQCTNGKPCTEEEHAFNRRTEVRIL